MIVDLSKFHELDPGSDGSFIEAWIVAFKKLVLCVESKVSQHRVTTWTSKASQSLLIRLPSLCFELGTDSFFVLSGLENQFFGNLENPLTDSCTNATYQSKPILFQGVPARDVRNGLLLRPTDALPSLAV